MRYPPLESHAWIEADGRPVGEPSYQALWFQLAAQDHRTTRAWADGIDPAQGLCALHHPGIGTAWIQRDGAFRHTGDTALADHLTRLTTSWDAGGRPAITRWTCTLHEHGPGHELIHIPHDWRTMR